MLEVIALLGEYCGDYWGTDTLSCMFVITAIYLVTIGKNRPGFISGFLGASLGSLFGLLANSPPITLMNVCLAVLYLRGLFMDNFKARAAHSPEFYIQQRWVDFLGAKGWHVERLVGNAFQKGIPDIFIAHPELGCRWVDIKVYGAYNFTKAQKLKWPKWEQAGIGIWIIGAPSVKECTKEFMLSEYPKLMEPPNWREFWKDSWSPPDIDALLDEIE